MPTRRQFLSTTAATLAAAALAPLDDSTAAAQRASSAFPAEVPAPEPPATNPTKKLGYALVGIGRLTQGQLLPAFAATQHAQLVALVTGHLDKAAPIVEKFHLDPASVYSYDNFDQIAHNPAIDVVYIVLPNGMHAEYTLRALKAGKHVLCEKPMANTSAECQQMIDAATAANRKLMIAYRCHFEPNNLKAIEICRSGQMGKPRLIISDHSFNLGDPTAWRLNKKLAGGGALMDVGIYSLNACRYLSGEEPLSVTAHQTDDPANPRFKEVEESIAWTMKFPSGLLTTCTTSYNAVGTNRLRVVFEHGLLDMEPATAYHNIQLRAPNPIQLPDINQFAAEMDHFSQSVANNTPPATPGEEGLKDLKIIEAIYESARTGKTITLS